MSQLAQARRWKRMKHPLARSSYPADWYIEDNEDVSQDPDHQQHEFVLQSTLLAWKKRTRQDHLLVGCEMACRWDPVEPRVGVGPDVYVVDRPPGDKTGYIGSLKTWQKGNVPPLLAIEIVSKSRPKKDYTHSPEKHDLLGTFELWVFDPRLLGYSKEQPTTLLQIFQRETNDVLIRRYAGAGPYRSDALEAWVMVIDGNLVIANDREAQDRWPTLEEEQRRRADAEAQRADDERTAKEHALKQMNDAASRADAEAKRADDAAKRADAEAKRADAERIAKEDAFKRMNDEAQRAQEALARIAKLEALLAEKS